MLKIELILSILSYQNSQNLETRRKSSHKISTGILVQIVKLGQNGKFVRTDFVKFFGMVDRCICFVFFASSFFAAVSNGTPHDEPFPFFTWNIYLDNLSLQPPLSANFIAVSFVGEGTAKISY